MPVSDQFRQSFRQSMIQDFYDSFSALSSSHWFLGIAKTDAWVNSSGVTNDNAPPVNTDCVLSDTDFWRKAQAFKKISSADVAIVVPRYDWVSGETYTAYRDDIDLFDDLDPAIFYVLVDDERVYKCIDNNYDAISTVAPTHTDSQIRTLADGYRWKYLYTISESKRKFLTKSVGDILGYMPVEYLTRINENDDRVLQWDVQNNAVNGSIDYIALNETLRANVISDRVLFYDDANQVISSTGAGESALIIGGSKIVQQNDYYNGMVLKIETGSGLGQYRVISDYTLLGNGTALVSITDPLNYGVSGGADPSRFSILPQVRISGDGSADTNILNTYSTSAEIGVSFLSTSIAGTTGQRYLDSFELINNGKNYTYADATIVAGLTFVSGFTGDIGRLSTVVMSPVGGHGSNPVLELGASSIMIATDLSQSEDGKITIANDYRQFALVKNPELNDPQVRLRLRDAGLSGSFVVGATAYQGLTGAYGNTGYTLSSGTIVQWTNGFVGTTGTAELILDGISGTFALNGMINGLSANQIMAVDNVVLAGTDSRLLRRLKLIPAGSGTFDPSGYDFTPGYRVVGLGLSSSNVDSSFSTGRVYKWQPVAANNSIGNLYLENPRGNFSPGEQVYQFFDLSAGISGPKGKITEIDESEETVQTVYSQCYNLNLTYDGGVLFSSSSFATDDTVSAGAASGSVIDWTASASGTTGNMRVLGLSGAFQVGGTILYTNSGTTGAAISSISSYPELKYHTGEVMHLQNIRPIERSLEQKEEIKLVVQF